MNDTTLIFPMAGKGARFGETFKPFLEVNVNDSRNSILEVLNEN